MMLFHPAGVTRVASYCSSRCVVQSFLAQPRRSGLRRCSLLLASALLHAGRGEVAVSPDGKFCSVLWPEQNEYALFATEGVESTTSWRELARGNAVSIVWAANSSTLAVLHVPRVGTNSGTPFCCSRCEHRHVKLNWSLSTGRDAKASLYQAWLQA